MVRGKNEIVLGCVADDFTGASDAASFLVREGIKTLLFNGVPDDNEEIEEDYAAIVIALKTRTADKKEAVKDTIKAIDWLKNKGTKQFYIKYCSTFDSTKEGNIGPIIDSVLERYNIRYTILCPALPVNKRIVKNGNLFVDGIPLNESSMKNHPLTPMWESDIAKLMEPQGKYKSLKVRYDLLDKTSNEINKGIQEFGKNKEHFYVIPDYFEEKHAKKIVEVFGDLRVLTGGSGLLSQLVLKYKNDLQTKSEDIIPGYTKGKGLILAGSCSKATLGQIAEFQNSGGISFKIEPLKLMRKEQTKEEIWNFIKSNEEKEVLLYSSDDASKVKETQKVGKEKIANLLEQTMAEIAKIALESGIKRIIVAGGETSGAVTQGLGYNSYIIGESIAPGVPIMVPLNNQDIRLVLKSGNFGQPDFFKRALDMTRE